jgi:hypothetical protein
VYHLIPDGLGHGLANLLSWTPDNDIVMVVFGDFNTYCLSWSLTSTTMSPWAATLKDWFKSTGLTLAFCPHIPTWHSSGNQWDSVLDLVLANALAVANSLLMGSEGQLCT